MFLLLLLLLLLVLVLTLLLLLFLPLLFLLQPLPLDLSRPSCGVNIMLLSANAAAAVFTVMVLPQPSQHLSQLCFCCYWHYRCLHLLQEAATKTCLSPAAKAVVLIHAASCSAVHPTWHDLPVSATHNPAAGGGCCACGP
jgi:hypothetical protein